MVACNRGAVEANAVDNEPCRLYTKAELGLFGNVPPGERQARALVRFRDADAFGVPGLRQCAYRPFIVGLISTTPQYSRTLLENWRRNMETNHPLARVQDVGDRAYWDASSSSLVVLAGKHILGVHTREEPTRARALKVATKALERNLEPVNKVVDPT